MANTYDYPMTHQGVRDLDQPRQPRRSSGVNVGNTERVISTVGGALLAGMGARRGGFSGLALAALGASLIQRGTTGHCALYSALGVDTAH